MTGGAPGGGGGALAKLLARELDAPHADLLRALVEPPIVVCGLDQHQLSFHANSLPGGGDSQPVRDGENLVTPAGLPVRGGEEAGGEEASGPVRSGRSDRGVGG